MHVTCPECGAPMQIEHVCVIGTPTLRTFSDGERREIKRLAAAGLCSRCECCIELTREQLRSNRP